MTDRDPQIRANELSGTSVPTPFIVKYYCLVEGGYEIEQRVHDALNAYRTNTQREFFECSIEDAVIAIKNVLLKSNTPVLHEGKHPSLNNEYEESPSSAEDELKIQPASQAEIKNLELAIFCFEKMTAQEFKSRKAFRRSLISGLPLNSMADLDRYENLLNEYLSQILEKASILGLTNYFETPCVGATADLIYQLDKKCEEKFRSWYREILGFKCQIYKPNEVTPPVRFNDASCSVAIKYLPSIRCKWKLDGEFLIHKESNEKYLVKKDVEYPKYGEVTEDSFGYTFHRSSKFTHINHRDVEK